MSAPGPQLRDIHLPQVSWWPPAPGWWMVLALALIVIACVTAFCLRHRRRARPRARAERELDALAVCYVRDRDAAALAAGLSRLLRRIALMIEPAAAAETGAAWRGFLDRRAPRAFTPGQCDILSEAPFRAHVSFDADALLVATRGWCERALRSGGAPRPDPFSVGEGEKSARHLAGKMPRADDAMPVAKTRSRSS